MFIKKSHNISILDLCFYPRLQWKIKSKQTKKAKHKKQNTPYIPPKNSIFSSLFSAPFWPKLILYWTFNMF